MHKLKLVVRGNKQGVKVVRIKTITNIAYNQDQRLNQEQTYQD